MNAIDAILPTHGLFHRAAACSPSLAPTQSVATAARIKYIIIEFDGLRLALFFHEAIQHAQAINRAQATPISAGFFHRTADGRIIIESTGSTSLGLEPGPDDANTIESTLCLLGL